jgi:hypothetical protein
MKYRLLAAVLALGSAVQAEVVFEDVQIYESHQDREFTLNYSGALQLCIKIPGGGEVNLHAQCSVRGGCLKLSDKTNRRSYGYTRHIITVDYDENAAGQLDFTVKNDFDVAQRIAVTAFAPNPSVDESFELPAGEKRSFTVRRDTPTALFARVNAQNVKQLDALCSPTSNCLKLEYFDAESGQWSWVASNAGIGKNLPASASGEIEFRVVNEYPAAVSVRATASDVTPAACQW